MTPADLRDARRRYFTGRDVTEAERAAMQGDHDAQGHAEADPINGTCFCCCEACDNAWDYAPTAGLTVDVVPVGIPGRVALTVVNTGPQTLTRAEAARVLRDAADTVEETPDWA